MNGKIKEEEEADIDKTNVLQKKRFLCSCYYSPQHNTNSAEEHITVERPFTFLFLRLAGTVIARTFGTIIRLQNEINTIFVFEVHQLSAQSFQQLRSSHVGHSGPN